MLGTTSSERHVQQGSSGQETDVMKRDAGVQTEKDEIVVLGDVRGVELAGMGEKATKRRILHHRRRKRGEFLEEASIISFFDNEEGLLIEQLEKEYEEQERDQKRRLDDGLEGASLLEMGGSEADVMAPFFHMACNDGEIVHKNNFHRPI
ncbi:uncharacterized protein G2W53_034946 [Senna tora]|uniref:Uncharacterized protein n=1 Tax=Senna tora TaxID=362788 RepID=A0A834W4G4_9FABA|nr:uncharacterized protein G2W53_034946 [Senna tora]